MGRTTDAAKRFMTALLALEPGTQNGGTYTYKPGYHASRADNIVMDSTDDTDVVDYSIRDAPDKIGPGDASAGFDWTFPTAQAGNYNLMDKYGERLEAAFNAKDPRLNGWREALGQTDLDATPEGLDFRYWSRRTPDSSHAWHWHFSEVRAYVELWDNKLAMLSILRGESLERYLANGGRLFKRDGTGYLEEVMTDIPLSWQQDEAFRVAALIAGLDEISASAPTANEPVLAWARIAQELAPRFTELSAAAARIETALATLVTPPSVEAVVDYAAIREVVKEALREGTGT